MRIRHIGNYKKVGNIGKIKTRKKKTGFQNDRKIDLIKINR